jgi:hypothetical protein
VRREETFGRIVSGIVQAAIWVRHGRSYPGRAHAPSRLLPGRRGPPARGWIPSRGDASGAQATATGGPEPAAAVRSVAAWPQSGRVRPAPYYVCVEAAASHSGSSSAAECALASSPPAAAAHRWSPRPHRGPECRPPTAVSGGTGIEISTPVVRGIHADVGVVEVGLRLRIRWFHRSAFTLRGCRARAGTLLASARVPTGSRSGSGRLDRFLTTSAGATPGRRPGRCSRRAV